MKLTSSYHLQAKFKGRIVLNNLTREAFTETWTADIFDSDTGESRTLDIDGPYLIIVDPRNKKKRGIEILRPESATQDGDRVTFTNTNRGLSKDDFDEVGGIENAQAWIVGTEIGIVTDFMNSNFMNELVKGERVFKNSLDFGAVNKQRSKLNFVYTPAFLTGGNAPTTDMATWVAVSDGEFTITIDGVARNIEGIDFSSGVGGMDQVAKRIEDSIREETSGTEEVEWNGTSFIIRSNDTTSSSAITVTSTFGGGVGTDISGAGATPFLDCDTGHGVVTNKNKGFLSSGTVANNTERDALTGVVNGAEIYVEDLGVKYDYLSGAWVVRDTGSATLNATTTVAGKVEIATAGESTAGTNTGGTGASLMVLPKQIANNLQTGVFIYASSTTGNDTYVATIAPTFSGYTNGMRFLIRVDTANTGPCTLEINSLGAVDIKLPSNGDPASGHILAGSIIDVVFDANNVKWILQNVSATLTGGNDASLTHYHNLVKNNALSGNQKKFYRLKDSTYVTTGTGSNVDTTTSVITGANNNDLSQIVLNFNTLNAVTTANVVNQHPEFRVSGAWASGTAQEGFIGFINAGSFVGTSLENSVMILDHFGFIVQDGTLFISCGDGAAQTKTDISATIPSVTAGHVFAASFDAITGIATFTVDNINTWTINATVPNSNLSAFSCAVIADASAVAKTISMDVAGWVAHDES